MQQHAAGAPTSSKRPDDHAVREKLRELAPQRRRFGYRRLGLMLERQGIKLNRKKLYRLYKEERLTVRKRGPLRKEILTDPQSSLGSTGETAAIISSVLSHSAERLTLQIPTGKRLQGAGIAIDSRARRVTDEVQWEPPI
jgi:HTH-like domain